ncbi:DUF4286 family protein [Novosphingobium sp.]|jgi:hypothetical protein|uniref:DUF4286 family protein n=1 Tax=Novosphingobium sp. TaxID=1874826 RepID=UPI0025EFDF6B|nr:DUF4286 family protein [Novosphingobium sp.]
MKGKMMADANAILLVMQNPKEGSAAAHRDWYVTHHLPDVCGVPGVLRGEFAAVAPAADQPRWSNAALYWLGGDGAAILGEVFRRAGSGDWVMSDTLDGATMLMAVGEALTGRVRSAITPDAEGKDRLLYIVLTNSTPGDDAAFNAWYDDVHLPDVLAVPGFVAAQRFRLADHPALKPSPFRYAAIYEVLAGEAESAFAGLAERAGTERMVLSPTLDTVNIHAAAFAPEGVCAGSA